ncbi:GDSL esterase/lipase [Dichanthelium oligosanthes]|uniref:GDSL esterase/lipase n=1 Tax=Dichanthelium oligosanthes TaxID=888268 RepID=A0A1E5UVZ3_9POAL|nr:GDSL esterase/lipase [Dichanthelium oligosanthes]
MAALAVVLAIAILAHCSVAMGAAAAAAADPNTAATRNFTIASPPSTPTTKGPVTYVFGDSMSDVGNNNYFPMSLAKSNYPWYGIDYPSRQATGRFTNGKTIGDYMADKLGVPSPPPFLSLSRAGKDVLGGVNFASGGAGILNETGVYFVQYLSFDEQITCFETVKKAMIAKIGKEAAEATVNAALFQIGLGSNDYINNFLQPFMADGTNYTHDQFIRLLIATLDRQLKARSSNQHCPRTAHAVRRAHLIPLASAAARIRSTDGKCLGKINAYAVQFNAAAKKLLDGMNAKLPGAQMALADCYSVVMELIEHPEKHGFTTAHTSCCNVDTEIGGLCLPNTKPCSDRRAFVFWDAYHTSDAANKEIADRLWGDMMSAEHGGASAPPRAGASGPAPAAAPSPSPSQDDY